MPRWREIKDCGGPVKACLLPFPANLQGIFMKVMLLNAPSALLNPLAAHKDLQIVQLDDEGRLKRYASQLSWRVKVVPHRTTSKLDPTAILNLRRHIAEHKPDVIHAFWGQSLA